VRRVALAFTCVALAFFATVAHVRAQDSPGRLHFAPGGATGGTAVVAHATGLTAGTAYALVWHTGDPHWRTDAGKFYGITSPDAARTLATGTSDAAGTLDVHFTVPDDFGYLHDVEIQPAAGAPAAQVAATQGFTVIPRISISPESGPPGTPITVTVSGIGYRFYQVVWHLIYDGAQTGWVSAVTTHGTARITIPASAACTRCKRSRVRRRRISTVSRVRTRNATFRRSSVRRSG